MPVFNRCCCCCQLRTGVTVLGWIGLVKEIIRIALVALAISKHDDSLFSNVNKSLGGNLNIDIWLTLQMCFAVIGLLTYIGLLWGSINGNRFFLVPWLFMGMIEIVLFFVIYIALVIAAFESSSGLGVFVLIAGLVILGFIFYIWLCVLSCFQHLRHDSLINPQIPIQSISVTHQIPYTPGFTVPTGSEHPFPATDMCQVVK